MYVLNARFIYFCCYFKFSDRKIHPYLSTISLLLWMIYRFRQAIQKAIPLRKKENSPSCNEKRTEIPVFAIQVSLI